jgi:hypothetical protein
MKHNENDLQHSKYHVCNINRTIRKHNTQLNHL